MMSTELFLDYDTVPGSDAFSTDHLLIAGVQRPKEVVNGGEDICFTS